MSFSLTLGTYDVDWPDVDEAVEWYGAIKGSNLDGTNKIFDIILSDINATGRIIEEAIIAGYAVLPGKIEITQAGQHDQESLPVLQLLKDRRGTDYPTTMALASGDPWPTIEDNPLFDATFVVQRGDTQFSCLGSELGDKLLDDDLLVAQRGDNHGSIVKANIQDTDLFSVTDGDNGHKSVTGAQLKTLFETIPTHWAGWNGGIWHVRVTGHMELRIGQSKTEVYSWLPDGSDRKKIYLVQSGEERVFVTDPDLEMVFGRNPKITNGNTHNKYAEFEILDFTDTSKVTTFKGLFSNCERFNSPLRGNWDTSKVTTFDHSFSRAFKFNQDIGGWDTSAAVGVDAMSSMFSEATKFNQDLSGWCVTTINAMPPAFDSASGFEGQTAKQPQWGTCPRGEDQV